MKFAIIQYISVSSMYQFKSWVSVSVYTQGIGIGWISVSVENSDIRPSMFKKSPSKTAAQNSFFFVF